MTAPLSDERLAEIRDRAEKAAPGPYEVLRESCDCEDGPCTHEGWIHALKLPQPWIDQKDSAPRSHHFEYSDISDFTNATVEFFSAAREDVPALLAEVERLRTELADLQGQNAMTESNFSNYVAEAIVTQDQLRKRAEAAESALESLLDGTDVTTA